MLTPFRCVHRRACCITTPLLQRNSDEHGYHFRRSSHSAFVPQTTSPEVGPIARGATSRRNEHFSDSYCSCSIVTPVTEKLARLDVTDTISITQLPASPDASLWLFAGLSCATSIPPTLVIQCYSSRLLLSPIPSQCIFSPRVSSFGLASDGRLASGTAYPVCNRGLLLSARSLRQPLRSELCPDSEKTRTSQQRTRPGER